jgi:hypothetical protein
MLISLIEKFNATRVAVRISIKETKQELATAAIEELNNSFLNLDGTNATVDSDTLVSGQWGYFVAPNKDGDDSKYLVKLSDCATHTEDTGCANKDSIAYYYRDSDHAFYKHDENEWLYTSDGSLKINETLYANANYGEDAYLPVNVPTISVERNTWNIKSMNEATSLKAGEISMSINGLDLSDVVNSTYADGTPQTLDIRDLKWSMPTEDEATLSLAIRAVIAGGNVNEEGCVPVVKVTYKVSPAMDLISAAKYEPIPTDES